MLVARNERTIKLALSIASVAVSLGLRVFHRGPYIPGWDVLGGAQGLALVSTRSAWDLAHWYWVNEYRWILWNLYGAPVVLLPGALAALWPWEYWNHVVSFLLVGTSIGLVSIAIALPARDAAVLLLTWGASSALLSWSVAGFSYATGFLPHALALAIVLRLSRRPIWTAILCGVTQVLSWHVQDLGQTVFVVFLAAVVFLDGSWATRAVWLATGLWQLWMTVLHPTQARFRDVPWLGVAGTGERLLALGKHLFTPGVDLPAFLALGLLALVLLRRHRWFWRTLVAMQLALVVALAMKSVDWVWPRRFLMVTGYSFALIVALYEECTPRARRALTGALVVANLWQLAATVSWSTTPFERKEWGVAPLPEAHSTVDYSIPFVMVDWYLELRSELATGKKLVLLYNHSSYRENPTDPAGILERLYLALGHEEFRRSVVVFGDETRWGVEIPIRRMSTLSSFIDGMGEPSEWVGYQVTHVMDPDKYRQEVAATRLALERRFRLEVTTWRDTERTHVERFLLRKPTEPAASGN